jgi:hypothetical protein
MGLLVDLQYVAGIHVGVPLSRLETGVAEELLDRPQVRAPLQEVGREAVA